jgi:integrase
MVIDAARDAVTLATVAQRFLEDYVEAKRKPATLRLYRLAITGHIVPRLGPIPIADVSSVDAAALHHRLRGTPYLANRALAVLSKLLAWSATAKYRAAGPNPCAGIEKYRERRRKRYLTADEYARLGRALRQAAIAPAPRTAIELLLLTGARGRRRSRRSSGTTSISWAPRSICRIPKRARSGSTCRRPP